MKKLILLVFAVLLVGCTSSQVATPLTGIKSPLVLAYNEVGESTHFSQQIHFTENRTVTSVSLENRAAIKEGTVSFCCKVDGECWGYVFSEDFECTEKAITPKTTVEGKIKVHCFNAGGRKCLIGIR